MIYKYGNIYPRIIGVYFTQGISEMEFYEYKQKAYYWFMSNGWNYYSDYCNQIKKQKHRKKFYVEIPHKLNMTELDVFGYLRDLGCRPMEELSVFIFDEQEVW